MASVLVRVRVGWYPLGIKSLGFLGIPFVLISLLGDKLVARGESFAKDCLNHFENSLAAFVMPVRVVFLRNSVARTPWHPFVHVSLWEANLVARGESSVKECLNMFENARSASVSPGVTTSALTVRRRWKVMTTGLWPPWFLFALVKHGFAVGSCMGSVVSLRN